MTPEDQNKAIAEACGHKYHKPTGEEIRSGSYYQYEPDYVNDLNLMHSAEGVLSYEALLAFDKHLFEVCDKSTQKSIHATAAQRACAFLKTLGLWKETP